MKIAITGATGLLGSELVDLLKSEGHECIAVTRSPNSTTDVGWNPEDGEIDADKLKGVEIIVHLAGENISSGRWTEAQKQNILNSREKGTRLIAETAAALEPKPRALICASAIGIYGDAGDKELTEDSPSGDLFLSEVCRRWEAAADPARTAGIRTAHMRFGVILTSKGGALAKMLLPFKMGVGGKIASGTQWMSWITLTDAARAVLHVIQKENISGPINTVSPNPVTNADFTKALGKALRRPTIFPMPAFAARLAFGQMADELLIASDRVLPVKLQNSGFEFRDSEITSALNGLLS